MAKVAAAGKSDTVLIDARSLRTGSLLETDLCVVGAGAAGITIAREFAGGHLKVCLLESGGLEPDPATQLLYQGAQLGLRYFPLDATRLRYFGGTTNHWAGFCSLASHGDALAQVEWIPHSGWPFPRTTLDLFYERAQRICQLGPFNYDPDFWADQQTRPLLPFDRDRVVTRVTQFSVVRFGTVYREELVRADNVSVLLHANVLEFEISDNAKVVDRVRVATLTGVKFRVKARVFVLAAGGIENARLLLLSNSTQREGVGNRHDLVGRFFSDHVAHPACGVWLPFDRSLSLDFYQRHAVRRTRVKGSLRFSDEVRRRERMVWTGFGVEPVYDRRFLDAEGSRGVESYRNVTEELRQGRLPGKIGAHMKNMMLDLDDLVRLAYRKAWLGRTPLESITISVGLSPAPNPDSRVTLGTERDALGQRRVQLDWRLTDLDEYSFRRSQRLVAEEIGHLGLGRVRMTEVRWPPSLPGSWIGGNHHMGTTRMHESPRSGVVNVDSRVHSVENLFVAGSSVFPTASVGVPTLLIVALALRLSDHLKERFLR